MFSFSLDTGQSPQVGINANGQVSTPFGSFSIQSIANKIGGTSQGTPATTRIQEPALVKAAPQASPWQWLKARPMVIAGIVAGLLGLVWVIKRKG